MNNESISDPYYLIVLQAAFDERKLRNVKYSLRAFSRDLNIAPSYMSEVLKGKKKLSSESACKIALKLGLDDGEFIKFLSSTVLEKE